MKKQKVNLNQKNQNSYFSNILELDIPAYQKNIIINDKRYHTNRIIKLLSKGFPIEYVTHEASFYNSIFYVNKNILIPRIETEKLVEYAIKEINNFTNLNIIDLGTGCGNIAISIAKNINSPNKIIYAVDINSRALIVAKKNHKKLIPNSKIHFYKSNLFSKIYKIINNYPIYVVANLPYVPYKFKNTIQESVLKYEPLNAVINDQNIFQNLFNQIIKFNLNVVGGILEVDYRDINNIINIIPPKYKVTKLQDQFQKPRFIRFKIL